MKKPNLCLYGFHNFFESTFERNQYQKFVWQVFPEPGITALKLKKSLV
jgi:hypothetical protein